MGRSLQELYAPALLQEQPQLSGAWASHCTSSQATTLLFPSRYPRSVLFFFKQNFFFLYYFAPDLYDYRKAVDSSAKVQSNEAVLGLDGIKSLVKGPVQGAPLPPIPVRRRGAAPLLLAAQTPK